MEPVAGEHLWRIGTLVYTKAGLITLASWLLWGDFAWSIRDRSVGTIFQVLLRNFKASDTVMGLLIGTFPAAIGLLLGPVISYRSDQHRGRLGRRLPFLLASAPVAAVAIIGLGFSPLMGQGLHRLLGVHSPGLYPSVLLVLAMWWIVFDLATVVTNNVFGALINDVVPHDVMGRFYGAFRAVSLLVGIAFNCWFLGRAEEHYQWVFGVVGGIYGIGVVWMCWKVREGAYPPPVVLRGSVPQRFWQALRDYFRQGFTQPCYLWFFAGSSLAVLALGPVNLYSVFFAGSLHVGMDAYGKYLACTYVISLCLSYVLGSLVDRFHPLRVSIVVIALYGLITLCGAMYATTAGKFAVALIAHGVVAGTYYTCSASLAQRLLPPENFAQLCSAGGIIGSLLNMAMPPILGHVLDLSQHNYRLTYLAGTVLSIVALCCLLRVDFYWRRLGRPQHLPL